MANYYPKCRSNYFAVKDPELFKLFCDLWNVDCWEEKGLYGFGVLGDNGYPNYATIEVPKMCEGCERECFFCPCHNCEASNGCIDCPAEPEDDDEVAIYEFDCNDFENQLIAQLVDGHVAIIIEIGYEKFRYLNGYAVALNSKGERRLVNLDDIYKIASEIGTSITRAEY